MLGFPVASIRQPLLPDVGVVALIPEQWSMHWMGRHQLLTRLAQYFHVVWVNPAREWRDMLTGRQAKAIEHTFAAQAPGFTVYTPEFWLPKVYRPVWLARLTFHQRLKRARQLLTKAGCEKIILYLWRPYFADALECFPFSLSCYHIADEYSFSDAGVSIDQAEKRLIERVNQVFITSRGLLEKKGSINPHATFVPNGVDYQLYSTSVPEPPDLRPVPHPRIGYTGTIKRTLDWPLLDYLSMLHPEWHFVFVGPENRNHPEISKPIQELSSRRNVHFLGFKPVWDLAAYPQHFDVCIMPYREKSHSAKYGYPLKLHEYLASGRPTVGTRVLRALEEFSDVVALPSTPNEWSVAIEEALSPAANTHERRAGRQAVARQHDWELLAARIAKTMAQRLGREFADRLASSVPEGPDDNTGEGSIRIIVDEQSRCMS